jgi:hypothetical protein
MKIECECNTEWIAKRYGFNDVFIKKYLEGYIKRFVSLGQAYVKITIVESSGELCEEVVGRVISMTNLPDVPLKYDIEFETLDSNVVQDSEQLMKNFITHGFTIDIKLKTKTPMDIKTTDQLSKIEDDLFFQGFYIKPKEHTNGSQHNDDCS